MIVCGYRRGRPGGCAASRSRNLRRPAVPLLRSVRFWLGVLVSVGFVALFLRTTHLGELRDALAEAEYWWLVPALALFFVTVLVRCMRWSILMRPIAELGPMQLFPYVIIGYMANNLLPARAGEVVRAYVLGDRENVSKVATLGSIAVERLFDGCILVLMLLVAGAIAGFDDSRLTVIAIASGVIFALAFIGFYSLTLSEPRTRRFMQFLVKALPKRLEHLAEGIVEALVLGLRSVHNWRTFLGVTLLSVLAWIIEAAAYMVVGYSFNMDLSFAHFAVLLAASNMVIIIPTFLGGTGPFEWAAKLVLVGAGVAGGVAGAYAIVAHQLIVLPTTILGLLMLWAYGIGFNRISKIETAEEGVVPAR